MVGLIHKEYLRFGKRKNGHISKASQIRIQFILTPLLKYPDHPPLKAINIYLLASPHT